MSALRNPLMLVGVVLIIIGFGNWYTGVDKGAEYERLLATWSLPTPVDQYDDFSHLNARTATTLLDPLQRGSDEYTLANAKLEFYKVVQSGGRMLILLGLFCSAASAIRWWQRRRLGERGAAPVARA
ncbi:MAG TPA: hypothetical protein VMW56_28130 [Candidatus Margulisiibacteriota bacterium]|nr:hypothetical protein [Candidatus Margulisiibacteriota bacterium]